MCGYEFEEYHCCIKCRAKYQSRYNKYACTPPIGQQCSIETHNKIPPLIHYDFSCETCRERLVNSEMDVYERSRSTPLLWDVYNNRWSSIW